MPGCIEKIGHAELPFFTARLHSDVFELSARIGSWLPNYEA